MKATHRPDIFLFSAFDPVRDLDFNATFIVRPAGNVLVDPLAMSDHDRAHAERLGGVAWIVVTNSDHVRASRTLAETFGAALAGPAAEAEAFDFAFARVLTTGDVLVPGVEVVALDGSKTPGELALIVDGDTLVTGDLVRAPRGGSLTLLPQDKLRDPVAARRSVAALAQREGIRAVLVGDGWPVFHDGRARLAELA